MDTKINEEQLEQDIINAIRARGLREQMQQWESEAKPQQTIRPLWPRVMKILSPIAVAAVLIGIIVTVVPTSTWYYGYRQIQREFARFFHQKPQYQNSSEVLLALAEPSISEVGERSNSSHALGHDDPVYEAVMEMNAGHYRAAQSILDDVQCTTSESNPRYDEIMDDVDYLYALCELGRGSRTKAYRQLKAISTSDSRHARQAAELIKHFK